MANAKELLRTLRESRAKSDRVTQQILIYARSLVPTLKDAGRDHAATELDRLLFEYDALMQEQIGLVREDLDSFLEIMTQMRPEDL